MQQIYQNELDKTCFQPDMAYWYFKDLFRTASDKVWLDKGFNITIKPKYDGYQWGLTSKIYKVFDKKSSDSSVKSEIFPNQQSPKELHKLNIGKSEKWKTYTHLKDNIWEADFTDMPLLKILLFLLMFRVNMQGLFLWTTERVLVTSSY